MRRIIALGGALVGLAVLAVPLSNAAADSGRTHPPHVVRRNAANLMNAHLDAGLLGHAGRVSIKRYADAVAYNQAIEAAQAAAGRRSGHTSADGGGGGGTCAGSIPGNIIFRESKCNPMAVNSRSGAAGKYQFLASTWNNYGGYSTADQAPESVQDEYAAGLWAAGGCHHWNAC